MRALIEETAQACCPEVLVEQLRGHAGIVLLRSSLLDDDQGRYSFIVARPFLTFRSAGSHCELRWADGSHVQFGDPWRVLEGLIALYELPDEIDLPFPLGGCFGYWGYELKNFIEPRLTRRALNDLEFPECHLGFYDSLVAIDHLLGKTWIVATGLDREGMRDEIRARQQLSFWREQLSGCNGEPKPEEFLNPGATGGSIGPRGNSYLLEKISGEDHRYLPPLFSDLTQHEFMARVGRAQSYIRSGDIYQVNLSQRLTVGSSVSGWQFFRVLSEVSPAPFSAYLDGGDFQVASSSPELFLRLSGSQIRTRPIKGTRPRSADPTRDSQLSYQLQTSTKEMAELVMITDLLRNDLGRVCQFGSVQVSELARLERYAQVQHLVSTVEGTLRKGVTHLGALAACFPGGSITGTPKIRAMEIIDELEPVCRGPYTGALGYLGFNRESQFSMIIRTMLCKDGLMHFPVGAGIVADSIAEAEYFETIAKARGFLETLRRCYRSHESFSERKFRS